MLLTPTKYQLQLTDVALENLYKVGKHHGSYTFWGKHRRDPRTDFSYPAEYMCQDFGQAISRLLMMVVERTSGYCIPGTDFPYVVIAMRIFAKMECLYANHEHQLAGLAWVLVYHKFATVEEIREICGDYVAELVTIKRVKKDEEDIDDIFFAIEDKDEPDTFIVPMHIQDKFIQMETSLLLEVLRKIRYAHDRAFAEANPDVPQECFWDKASIVGYNRPYDEDEEEDYAKFVQDDDGCDDEKHGWFLYGCDGPSERGTIEYDYSHYRVGDDPIDGQSYYKKGFRNQEYTEFDDEHGYDHFAGEIVQYRYTPEYMAYCDRCRDLFWQRFGLQYEDVEKMLITLFWDGKEPWNPVNDLLYEVSKRYYICEQ